MISSKNYLGLDESHLVLFPNRDFFKGLPSAVEAFERLRKKALDDGISLDLVSAYRSFERQLKIFDDKFNLRRPVLGENETPLDLSKASDKQKVDAILRYSAIPGLSRHHFGTDFDIYSKSLLPSGQKLQLTAYEYDKDQYFYPLELWLSKNLSDFGFIRPFTGYSHIAYEPWHISYIKESSEIIKNFDIGKLKAYLKNLDYPWIEYVIDIINKKGKSLLGV